MLTTRPAVVLRRSVTAFSYLFNGRKVYGVMIDFYFKIARLNKLRQIRCGCPCYVYLSRLSIRRSTGNPIHPGVQGAAQHHPSEQQEQKSSMLSVTKSVANTVS